MCIDRTSTFSALEQYMCAGYLPYGGRELCHKNPFKLQDIYRFKLQEDKRDDDDDVYYPRGRRPKMMNDYGRLREATATTEREGATRAVRSDWGK